LDVVTRDGKWRSLIAAGCSAFMLVACGGGSVSGTADPFASTSSLSAEETQLSQLDNLIFAPPVTQVNIDAGAIPTPGYWSDAESPDENTDVDTETDDDDIATNESDTTPSAIRLSWQSTVTDTEQHCTHIRAYRFNLGLSPDYFTESVTIRARDIVCEQLSHQACGAIEQCSVAVNVSEPASWYVTVQAIDQHGVASDHSNVAVATVY